jgi:hypothetical protein
LNGGCKITKEAAVIIADSSDKHVVSLLLDRGEDVKITEEMVAAAAGNEGSGRR